MIVLWLVLAFMTGGACGAFALAAVMLAAAVNKRGDQLAANLQQNGVEL